MNKDVLLGIVAIWRPAANPEYRGFRCANCQEYIEEAWHHWIDTKEYKLPVHLCKQCESALLAGTLRIDRTKREKLRFRNSFHYSEKAQKRFQEIVSSWPKNREHSLHTFMCDNCESGVQKAWHVWYRLPDSSALAELHFCRKCGESLDLPRQPA